MQRPALPPRKRRTIHADGPDCRTYDNLYNINNRLPETGPRRRDNTIRYRPIHSWQRSRYCKPTYAPVLCVMSVTIRPHHFDGPADPTIAHPRTPQTLLLCSRLRGCAFLSLDPSGHSFRDDLTARISGPGRLWSLIYELLHVSFHFLSRHKAHSLVGNRQKFLGAVFGDHLSGL